MNEILIQILDLEIFHAVSSDSDDSGPFFWLAGPLGAVGFYSYIFLRYRNTNKRHEYETKTHSEIGQVLTTDQKVGRVRGVENRYMTGENSSTPRNRLGQRSTFVETWRQTGSE